MSEQLTQQASTYRVTLENGMTLVGWPIRADHVVVQASGLTGPITVRIDGQDVEVTNVYESAGVEDFSMPVTALELPEGSIDVPGEIIPPHMAPQEQADDGSQTMGARTFFWCLVFPRMRGCR